MSFQVALNTFAWSGLATLLVAGRAHPALSMACLGALAWGLNWDYWGWTPMQLAGQWAGDWSIGTALLVAVGLLKSWRISYGVLPRETFFLSNAIGLAALLLIVGALGPADWDPYPAGFSPVALYAGLAAAFALAWLNRCLIACVWLIASSVAFQFRALDSDNLWDYLLDPALGLWMLTLMLAGWTASAGGAARRLLRRMGEDEAPDA